MFPAFVCNTFGFLLLTTIGVHTPVRTSPHAPSVPVLPCSFGGGAHTLSYVPGATTPNTFVTAADPETRRFLVYVPSTYSAQHAP